MAECEGPCVDGGEGGVQGRGAEQWSGEEPAQKLQKASRRSQFATFHLKHSPLLRAGRGPVAVMVTGPGALGVVVR